MHNFVHLQGGLHLNGSMQIHTTNQQDSDSEMKVHEAGLLPQARSLTSYGAELHGYWDLLSIICLSRGPAHHFDILHIVEINKA